MRRIAIVILGFAILISGSLSGAILEVPSQYATIQAAIDISNAGDTVLVAPGTYKGASNRDIDFSGKAILVTSSTGAAATIIDCEGTEAEYHRGFYFHSGEDTTSVRRGFTITNGYSGESGGAICCIASSPRVLDNIITGDYANISGGGIYCEGTHSVISGNTISDNEVRIMLAATSDAVATGHLGSCRNEAFSSSPRGGGNICCIADSSLIELNIITGGKGTLGSALYCEGSIIIRDNTISGNGGVYTAGTVYCGAGDFLIERNEIVHNTASYDGAGMTCSRGKYTILGNTISHNSSWQYRGHGGGVFCESSNMMISNNDISENYTSGGGGLYVHGSGSICNNTISGNSCQTEYACKGCNASLSLSGGEADHGGGIAISGSSSLVVSNNIITGNGAPFGGGISCIYSNPEITDNIISLNGASDNPCGNDQGDQGGMGGGIYCSNSSPIIARNTIYANSALDYETDYSAGGGVFCIEGSSPSISQNIIANNQVDNEQNAGGIYCEDAGSVPTISCCDVYANSNANYGGSLGDQTGLNGNFSLDPIFCGPEYGDYELHILSPCLAGHHPGGEECGLIGALGGACDYVATLLQGYSTSVSPSAITITWTLAQAEDDLICSVLRAEARDDEYRQISAPGITRDGLAFTFKDTAFDPGTAYRYRVVVSDGEGRKVLFETSQIVTPVLPLSLFQNFPNPFNPSTTISYYLPEDSPVTLAVYDIAGRRIIDLVGKVDEKGRHAVVWSGEDTEGNTVASGIYFYRLTAGKETISKKMVLLR